MPPLFTYFAYVAEFRNAGVLLRAELEPLTPDVREMHYQPPILLDGTSRLSEPFKDDTYQIRVYVETWAFADIGDSPVAVKGQKLPLVSSTWEKFQVRPGQRIAVISRF